MNSHVNKWISSIKVFNLTGLDEEIKARINIKNKRCGEELLIILQTLAKACSYNDKKIDQGILVWKIAVCIIPHIQITEKCLNSLYFILQYLLNASLYEQSKEICNLAVSRKTKENEDIYLSIAELWQKRAALTLSNLSKQFDVSNYNIFVMLVQQYFTILESAIENHCKYIFKHLSRYSMTMKSIEVKQVKDSTINTPALLIANFFQSIFPDISNLKLVIFEPELSNTFQLVINFLETVLNILIQCKDFSTMKKVLNIISTVLLKIISLYPEESKYLKIQLDLYTAILKPPQYIDQKVAFAMENYIDKMKSLENKCKYPIIREFAIFQDIITYWVSESKFIDLVCVHFDQITTFLLFISQNMKLAPLNNCCSGKCSVKTKIYNSLIFRYKFALIMNKCLEKHFSVDISKYMTELVTEMAVDIEEMRSNGCTTWWWKNWTNLKKIIYNLAHMSKDHAPEQSLDLYTLLCSGIANLEDDSHKDPNVTITSVLSKITHVYCSQKKYDEAMATIAFWGLYSYNVDDSKCFRLWRRLIQENEDTYKEITMVSCLRSNIKYIEELGLKADLRKCVLAKLCLCEIQGFLTTNEDMSDNIISVLNEIEKLGEDYNLEYARGVQLLGLHVIQSQSKKDIKQFVEKAKCLLQKLDDCLDKTCLAINLDFCLFINSLNENIKISENEVKVINALLKTNLNKDENVDADEEDDFIVPSFEVINVRHDEELMKQLKQVQEEWRKCFINDMDKILETWKPDYTLNFIMFSGQYSKLYSYHACEVLGWKLALKLARDLNNDHAFINIVGYLLSARVVRNDWIDKAKLKVTTLENSVESADIYVVATFRIKLADYYLKIERQEEAINLLNKVCQVASINVCSSVPIFLQLMSVIMYNYHIFKPNVLHPEYSMDIAASTYGMLNMYTIMKSSASQENWPYSSSTVFDFISHFLPNMDSLMHREALAHLQEQFQLAEQLSCTLRLGMIIKILCTLDLNKTNLNDCEVKLSSLEKILGIENELLRQPADSKKKVTETKFAGTSIYTIRDACYSRFREGSILPALQTVHYIKPSFMSHESTCSCYKCKNTEYQSLVFASNGLRAQFYTMKNKYELAFEYFKGAYRIRRMFAQSELKHIQSKDNNVTVKSFWFNQQNLIEFVAFLLKFSDFLKSIENKEKAIEIARETVYISEKHRLISHPIYAKVLYQVKDRFYEDKSDFNTADIEDASEILEKLQSTPFTEDFSNKKCSPTETNVFIKTKITRKKRSPKHFQPNHKSVKIALQKTLEAKSPIKIYKDNSSKHTNIFDSNSQEFQEIKPTEKKTSITTRRQGNTRKGIKYTRGLLNRLKLETKSDEKERM